MNPFDEYGKWHMDGVGSGNCSECGVDVEDFLSPVWESIEGKVYCPKCAGVLMSGFREDILCRAMEIMKDILDKEMEYGRAMEKKYLLSSVIEQWFLAFKR